MENDNRNSLDVYREVGEGGGRWGFVQLQVRLMLDSVAADIEYKERWPRNAATLTALAEMLFEAIDDADMVLSAERPADAIEDGSVAGGLFDILSDWPEEKEGPIDAD